MSNDSLYRVLHVADPHFTCCHFSSGIPAAIGKKHGDELVDVLDKNRLCPPPFDIIVLSGDFTFSCKAEGFEAAEAFVSRVATLTYPGSVVVLPGNHDIQLINSVWIDKLYLPVSKEEAEARFREFLSKIERHTPPTNEWLTSAFRAHRPGKPGLVVVGLNSCRVERMDAQGWGYVGDDQLYEIGKQLVGPSRGASAESGDIVIAVTHHNPLPIWDLGLETMANPLTRRKFSFMMDTAGLLNFLSDFGIMVLMHGHTHKQSVKLVDGYGSKGLRRSSPMWVLGAGSFGIQRKPTDPAHHFQIIEIGENALGNLDMKFQDFVSQSNANDDPRPWEVIQNTTTIPLTSTWDTSAAEVALAPRRRTGTRARVLMENLESWSKLRKRKLDPGNWRQTLSELCDRITLGAQALGLRSLSEKEIRHVVETLFQYPPSDYELCQFSLEQIVLRRWLL